MTLDEAIKELESGLADKWCPWGEEMKASIRLGIEALRRVKECGQPARCGLLERLPGETEK